MKTDDQLFRNASTLLIALTLGGAASAIDWRTGDSVTVAKSEIIQDDLYVAGNNVQIDGTVNGDLFVGGRTVTINGEVRGNLWASGETLILGGKVSQTARFAGSVIRVQNRASIGRDLLAAGSEVVVAPGVVIGRDVAVGSSQAQLDGRVTRNAYVGANGIEVGGVIGGNAKMAVGNTAVLTGRSMTLGDPGLRFTQGGRIAGNLTLQRSDSGQAALPAGVVGGQVTYAPINGVTIQPRRNPLTSFLSAFVGSALLGLLLFWLARPRLLGVWEKLRTAPASSLGYGALAFIGLPALALLGVLGLGLLAGALLLLRLGGLGLPLAFIGMPVLLGGATLVAWLALLGAQGFAAYLIGTWIVHALRPQATFAPVATVLIGALLLALVLQIPVLGALATLAALLLSLGALWLTLRAPPRRPLVPQVSAPQAT
ncbi:polymer-forming cytoskeletal protein [Deinococcus alpinitundrae]|uniref:polymer-forming cytoskeletal protein n=1 Tax=Deinococcus alpinitundrae TaxID=468913 RepID=UPI00137B7C58|nr:polymer-forming cytoskeletal protein [Deinococcus alpinitundrae]